MWPFWVLVILFELFLALSYATVIADTSIAKYGGHGGSDGLKDSFSIRIGHRSSADNDDTIEDDNVPRSTTRTLNTSTSSKTTVDDDPLSDPGLAVTVVPFFAAETTRAEDFELLRAYLSLQFDHCHAKSNVHYSLGVFNAFDGTDVSADRMICYCDQCDCQSAISTLTPANVTVSKEQNVTFPGYMSQLVYFVRRWKPLSYHQMILVTNIKCIEVKDCPAVNGTFTDSALASFESDLFDSSTRVLLIWIDPGEKWQATCNLSVLQHFSGGHFKLNTPSSLSALLESDTTPCPSTGGMTSTHSLLVATSSVTMRTATRPPLSGSISKVLLISIICVSVLGIGLFICCVYLGIRRRCYVNSRLFGGSKMAPRFPIIPVIAPSSQPSKIFGSMCVFPLTVKNPDDEWEIDDKHLLVNEDEVLGTGAFAIVCKGCLRRDALNGMENQRSSLWRMETLTRKRNQVAVKRLKKDAVELFREEFMREIEFMKRLGPHPHVLQMVGYVRTEEKIQLLLLEYCADGDLLFLLRRHRACLNLARGEACSKIGNSCVQAADLPSFAWQVADGMTYLSAKRLIHRDLAARNVLVNKRYLKIADFGLTRFAEEPLYTTKGGRLPIKWMSPESLKRSEFSTASDVWSYGVLLYEVFSAGNVPYAPTHPSEMLAHLESGERLEKPEHATDEIYAIMRMCWSPEPLDRPHFEQLRNDLQTILECLSPSYGYLEV